MAALERITGIHRRRVSRRALAWITAVVVAVGIVPAVVMSTAAAESSGDKGPVGWDSYRNPERMTEIGSGSRTKQFSSFDRAGSNDDGFEGTHSCLRDTDAGCVIAEHSGAGEVSTIWFTRDNGDVSATGRITIELDGETVVDGSLQDIVNGDVGAPFVHPMVANAEESSGGVYIKVPMPYRETMRITTENNPLFYRVMYRDFADAEGVSTFDPTDPAEDVITKLRDAGTVDPKPPQDGAETSQEPVEVGAGETATLARTDGPGAIGQLRFTLPQLEPGEAASDAVLHDARLRISFDGETTVDAPLGEFFGTGLGLYDVRSMMFGVDAEGRQLTSWWLMPYRSEATIEIVNESDTAISDGTVEVTAAPDDRWEDELDGGGPAGYFYAIGNRDETTDGQDHVFADLTGRGRVVGVTQSVEGQIETGNIRNYLEGDERVFTDGAVSPDVHGTGTEDFYEGGWYFSRGTFNAPMNGNPVHEEKEANCEFDCTGMYRLFVAEGMEFDSSMRFSIEHGPANNEPALYGSTTYAYQQPDRGLSWSDTVDVGDEESEAEHDYTSDDPGEVESLTSTFEGHDGPTSPTTLDGRATTAPVSFTMNVEEDNAGVVLRRTGDQNSAYQGADVSVDGENVGTWEQPLGNETSRWLDDSFTLPESVTAGKSSITVELTPLPDRPGFHAASYSALSRVTGAGDGEAPSTVAGLSTRTPDHNAIAVEWQPATDDVYAPRYEIYGSTEAGFKPGEDNLLGRTGAAGFVHEDIGAGETWYYRVRAVDREGNTGEFSEEIDGVSGDNVRVEAEKLLPPVDATAALEAQSNCCGIQWSNGAQLWFRAEEADNGFTVAFDIPSDGTYDLSLVHTLASDYGSGTVALDGEQIGEFDGYDPELRVADPRSYGEFELAAGEHELTVTIAGKHGDSSDFMAGLDYINAELVK